LPISNSEAPALNDRVTIDFSIEETAAVIQFIQSHRNVCLEMKIQDQRVHVDLYSLDSTTAEQCAGGSRPIAWQS
jgi:hypothetical protein